MANPEHLAMLKQGVVVWNRWRAEVYTSRSLSPSPDLSGASLFSANLRGVDLSNSNLQGCDLRSAHLLGANLRDAHLAGASLSGANLLYAHFGQSHQSHAFLHGMLSELVPLL